MTVKKLAILLTAGAWLAIGAGEQSNRRAPSFSLPDSNMVQHDILDYRGKVLIIEFMQTKCPTCQELTKALEQKVKPKFGDKVAVLSIVVPPDNIELVKKYVDVFKVTSPILFDSGQVAGSYSRATPQRPQMYFPHVFLIDAAGQIRNDWAFTAPKQYPDVANGDRLIAEVEKLLAETPAATKKTAAKPAVKK
jgi:peroxiredoxin